MALRLNGSSSGYVELDVPAAAGSHTLTLPDGGGTAHQVLKNSATAGTLEYGLALPTGNGTSGQYLQSDGTGGSSWQTVSTSDWTEATTTSTSGSTVEFTGLPSDVKEIVVVWYAVSSNTNATLGFRLGTGATPTYATTGYNGFEVYYGTSDASVLTTTDRIRFTAVNNTATHLYYGQVALRNPTGNTWVTKGETWSNSYGNVKQSFGKVALGDTLTAIQFLWSTGNFDAGNWKIMYRR
jgi:hypothetical protein